MSCSTEQLALYVGGDLSPDECEDVIVHVTGCAPCRAVLKALQADATRLQHLEPAAVLPGSPAVRQRAPLRWGSAVAVALLCLGLVTAPAVQALGQKVYALFPFLTVKGVVRCREGCTAAYAP
jgi:anti-sigma factor RsiW